MPPARRTRPRRSLPGVRGAGRRTALAIREFDGGRPIGRRVALALCAAVLAAVGLSGAAAPALGAAAVGPWSAGATQIGRGPAGSGYGATPTPATVRVVGHTALSGAATRVRPYRQHENSKPAHAAVHRGQPDLLPVAVIVARLGPAEPFLLAAPALSGAPSRAPPAPAGLPDTRAPPASGRL